MKNFFSAMRYERPLVFFSFNFIFIIIFGFYIFINLPDTRFTRSVGILNGQVKVNCFKNYLYWKFRSETNPKTDSNFTSKFGTFKSLGKDGVIIFNVGDDSGFNDIEFRLADLKIINVRAINEYFNTIKGISLKLEIVGGAVIVYKDGIPLNLLFINENFAVPEPNPPSNIVDAAFALYYWKLFAGETT